MHNRIELWWLLAAAAVAFAIGRGLPVLGPVVFAIIAGIALRSLLQPPGSTRARALVSRTGANSLKAGVALLGLLVSLGMVADVGWRGLMVAFITAGLTLVATVAAGRRLGVPAPLALLIAAGSSICGASAIAAVDSVTRSDRQQVVYAIGVVSVLGTVTMLTLPTIATRVLGLPDTDAGVWAGASLQEVAQVTGAGALISATALQTATVVKLFRVALLGPLVAALAMSNDDRLPGLRASIARIPPFLLAFFAFSALATAVTLPEPLRSVTRMGSGFLITIGLVALGSQLDLSGLRNAGWRPLLLGFIAAVIAAFGSLAVLLLLWS